MQILQETDVTKEKHFVVLGQWIYGPVWNLDEKAVTVETINGF